MLKRLKIENFVLMKTCEIEFSPSLNIITGETGTGKSVLLSALQLLLGAKAESSSIRHGETEAIIEGSFCVSDLTPFRPHLEEFEIELEENILIRREISKSGKHKTTINGMMVPMSLIRCLSPFLLDHHDLETCFLLRSHSYALEKLDLFGELISNRNSFSALWKEFVLVQERLARLLEEDSFKEVELAQLEKEIESLESLHLSSFNEVELFDKYQKALAMKKEMEHLNELEELIDNDHQGLLTKLFSAKQLSQGLGDTSLSELIDSAHIQIKEASYIVQKKKGDSVLSDKELEKLDHQLTLFESLKRKLHASSKEELLEVLSHKKTRRETLLRSEETKVFLLKEQERLQRLVDQEAHVLTEKRKKAADILSKEIEKYIRTLNMPEATFIINISKKERTNTGDETCTFSFVPNPGERMVDVHKGASNGELARIFLSLSTLLAAKEPVSTLLFDEIDSNIGGMTALSVGALLEEMSKTKQILAITHFPQVAQFAHAHFALTKEVINDRTITSITRLKAAKERKQEQLRMSGKKGDSRPLTSARESKGSSEFL